MGKKKDDPNADFDDKLAAELMAVLEKCLDKVESLDLGRTRHRPLPDIIPQESGWKVDAKKLRRFETLLHFMLCALFGVDGDGDRAVRHTLTDRSRFELNEPPFRIPHLRGRNERNIHKLFEMVELSHGNLQYYNEIFERHMRMLAFEQRERAQRDALRARAKGCQRCKERGHVRAESYEIAMKWHEANKEAVRALGPSVSEPSILCPECHSPEKIKAFLEKRFSEDEDEDEDEED